MMTDANDWEHLVLMHSPTGSRFICDPAPTDTDEDYICFQPRYEDKIDDFHAAGFSSEGHPEFYTENNRGNFRSLRRGDLNLIVTDDHDFYELFRSATALAKRLNLRDKSDRIALFQLALYGVGADNLVRQLDAEPIFWARK